MSLRDLSQQFASEGRIEAILLRPARGESAILVDEARAEPEDLALGRGELVILNHDGAVSEEGAARIVMADIDRHRPGRYCFSTRTALRRSDIR